MFLNLNGGGNTAGTCYYDNRQGVSMSQVQYGNLADIELICGTP